MEIAFTTARPDGVSHEVVCVVQHESAPCKGELVEINDYLYQVDGVEWHLQSKDRDEDGNVTGEVSDLIVRLEKIGEA